MNICFWVTCPCGITYNLKTNVGHTSDVHFSQVTLAYILIFTSSPLPATPPSPKNIHFSLLCPQLRRSWRGILVSGCPCVCAFIRSSRTVHARILKFHIWIPDGEKADTRFFFFLSELSPFLELRPFEQIRMKSDACHIIWTMHGRVMKSKKISNDQELIQSDPTSCPQNQKGNNKIHKLTAVYVRHSR